MHNIYKSGLVNLYTTGVNQQNLQAQRKFLEAQKKSGLKAIKQTKTSRQAIVRILNFCGEKIQTHKY